MESPAAGTGVDTTFASLGDGVRWRPKVTDHANHDAAAYQLVHANRDSEADQLLHANRDADSVQLIHVNGDTDADQLVHANRDADQLSSANQGAEADRLVPANQDTEADQLAIANLDAEADRLVHANRDADEDQLASTNRDADTDRLVHANRDADADQLASTNQDTDQLTRTNQDADQLAKTNQDADQLVHDNHDQLADENRDTDTASDADADNDTGAGVSPAADANHGVDPESDVEAQAVGADHDGVQDDPAVENDEGDHRSELYSTNFYAAKKTVAQGMMDIALITSNANQMRYLLEFGTPGIIYYFNLTLVIISLILQIAVGTALIFKGRADLREEPKLAKKDKRLNDIIVVGVFLITIINVFMAAFAIGSTSTSVRDGARATNLTDAPAQNPLSDNSTESAAIALEGNSSGVA